MRYINENICAASSNDGNENRISNNCGSNNRGRYNHGASHVSNLATGRGGFYYTRVEMPIKTRLRGRKSSLY